MPDFSEEGYEISSSGAEVLRLRHMLAQANRLDPEARRKFRRAFRHVFRKLRAEPLTWGEREYTLPHSGLPIYHALHAVFNVYYTVLEGQRSVVIQQIQCTITLPGESSPDEAA